LNAWYGKTQALYDIQLAVAANHATALIGTLGCRQVYIHSLPNRMHETIPEARSRGASHRRDWMLTTEPRPRSCGGEWDGFFKGESVSHDVDLR